MYRLEVIVDGDSLDMEEFKAQPQPGQLIEFRNGSLATIEHIRHNLRTGKLQAWCTKRQPIPTDRPLGKGKQDKGDHERT